MGISLFFLDMGMVSRYSLFMNWGSIIFKYFDKPERFQALEKLAPRIPEEEFWKILGEVWTNSESVFLNLDVVEKFLSDERLTSPHRLNMMDEDDRTIYDGLAPHLTIYRGGFDQNIRGWSWTTDRSMAIWFARRLPFDGQPLLGTAKVNKEHVIAYFGGRNESEIVVNPKHVKYLKRTSAGERKKSNSLTFLIQTGLTDFNEDPQMVEASRITRAIIIVKNSKGNIQPAIDYLTREETFLTELGFPEKAKEFTLLRETVEKIAREGHPWMNANLEITFKEKSDE